MPPYQGFLGGARIIMNSFSLLCGNMIFYQRDKLE